MQSVLREVRGGNNDKTIPKDQTEVTMASVNEDNGTGNILNVIRVDEGEIRNHLDGLVKALVEDVLTVNALGQALMMTDCNGTVHSYSYDVVGRQTADAVTTLGSGVNGTVRRLNIVADGAKRGLLHIFPAECWQTPALAHITADARPGLVVFTCFHTFPAEQTVVKTLSLLEWREQPPSPGKRVDLKHL